MAPVAAQSLVRTLVFVTSVVAAGTAVSGDWVLSNTVVLNSYYSDNLTHRDAGEGGFVMEVRPSLDLRGSGRRLRGGVSYSPSLFTYLGSDAPDNRLNHALDAASTMELVSNSLFVDMSANASLVSVGAVATGVPDDPGNRDEVQQTYSLSVSPYWVTRFGRQAQLLSRLAVNHVDGEDRAESLDSQGATAYFALSNVNTATARIPWGLQGTYSVVSYSGSERTSRTVEGSVGYRFSRRWRIDGDVGFESHDLDTLRDSTTGTTVSATAHLTPTPRTRIEATLGRRYFGNYWKAKASHRSRRSEMNLEVRREVTNARSVLLDRLSNQEAFDRGNLDLITSFDPDAQSNDFNVELLDQDYLNSRVSASFRAIGKRTTLMTRVSWSDREYEVTPLKEQVSSWFFAANRRIGGRLSMNVNVNWQKVSSSDVGDSEVWAIRAGGARHVGRYTHVGLYVSRDQRTGDDNAREYTEHRIGLTLRTRMF